MARPHGVTVVDPPETDPPPEAPQRPPTDIATISGTRALAALDDDGFNANLAQLKKGQERIRQIQAALMTPGIDYGTVPGTQRPTLMKPGAEKLTLAYGLVARIQADLRTGDNISTPAIQYDSQCVLHVGTWDGPIVAVGNATAHSWETKYRWRKAGRICPDCGRAGVIMTRRNVWWHPFDARPDGGCGGNFEKDDPRLAAAPRLENPDPWDNANTLLKIAEKRAHVDAVLRATASSGLFTQDVEDQPVRVREPEVDDWSVWAFRRRAVEFENEDIVNEARRMFPDATSLATLSDAERRSLYETLVALRDELVDEDLSDLEFTVPEPPETEEPYGS